MIRSPPKPPPLVGARSVERGPYGFKAVIELPAQFKSYVIVWRYDALPRDRLERRLLIEYLQALGELIPPMASVQFAGGMVHRRP